MQLRRYKERVADGRDSADEDARPASGTAGAWPSLPGDRGFELLKELGSGSSGTVYEARLTRPYGDLEVGARVAVKILRPELVADTKAQARLLAEGQLGMSIQHPNVAEIFGVETA